jgi:methionyl-tRNA formyltransferase
MKIVIASNRSWTDNFASTLEQRLGATVVRVYNAAELDQTLLLSSPNWVFFPFWSFRIKESILTDYNCVSFHMTDLPFGRGGSPLQNLISRGIYKTMISAFKPSNEMDAGPIFLKRPLELKGKASEIFKFASTIILEMIIEIVQRDPVPTEQSGAIEVFPRRKPEQSQIPAMLELNQLYDHIRMLDCEGYPTAFFEHSGYRFEFRNAELGTDCLTTEVTIKKMES